MDSTVSRRESLSNGNSRPAVATHCMDVRYAIYYTASLFKGGARALAKLLVTRDKFGDVVPMNENTFGHKVNPNCFSHNVTVEEARDMMIAANDYRVLHSLAADCGYVAIRTNFDGAGATYEKVGVMAKEFGDVVQAVSAAQAATSADGARISPNEMAHIEREAVDLIAALNSLVASIRAQSSEVL